MISLRDLAFLFPPGFAQRFSCHLLYFTALLKYKISRHSNLAVRRYARKAPNKPDPVHCVTRRRVTYFHADFTLLLTAAHVPQKTSINSGININHHCAFQFLSNINIVWQPLLEPWHSYEISHTHQKTLIPMVWCTHGDVTRLNL